MGGKKDKVTKLGSADDVKQVNPLTGKFWNQLGGMQQQFQGQMGQYSPEMMFQNLAGQSGQLQGLTRDLMGGYANRAQETAGLLSNQAMESVANQFGGSNALHSGAALSAMAQGAALPQAQLQQNLAQMESGIGQNLANQFLGAQQQGYGAGAQLLGTTMGLQGQLAAPEWWQPSYHVKEGSGGLFGNK
jgi:hypothetical protein